SQASRGRRRRGPDVRGSGSPCGTARTKAPRGRRVRGVWTARRRRRSRGRAPQRSTPTAHGTCRTVAFPRPPPAPCSSCRSCRRRRSRLSLTFVVPRRVIPDDGLEVLDGGQQRQGRQDELEGAGRLEVVRPPLQTPHQLVTSVLQPSAG